MNAYTIQFNIMIHNCNLFIYYSYIVTMLSTCIYPNLYHNALKTVILKTPFISLPTLGNFCIRQDS